MTELERARGELQFRPARDDLTLDVEAFARDWQGRHIKGLFCQHVLEQTKDPARALEAAGIPLRRVHAFTDVPYDGFLRLTFAVARTAYPTVRQAVAMRKLVRPFYPRLAESLIGRVVFGALAGDPQRVFEVGVKGWQTTLDFGRYTLALAEPGRVRYLFEEYPVEIMEISDAGVIDGALEALGVRGSVGVCAFSKTAGVLELRFETSRAKR